MSNRQAVLFYDGTSKPMAQVPVTGPVQACMLLGTDPAVAALASRGNLPAPLLDVLAGYALAGLDTNRQAAILADLGTGRIVTAGALRKRCAAALAAQAQEGTFSWG
jgi:hypothetical protein